MVSRSRHAALHLSEPTVFCIGSPPRSWLSVGRPYTVLSVRRFRYAFFELRCAAPGPLHHADPGQLAQPRPLHLHVVRLVLRLPLGRAHIVVGVEARRVLAGAAAEAARLVAPPLVLLPGRVPLGLGLGFGFRVRVRVRVRVGVRVRVSFPGAYHSSHARPIVWTR